MNRPTVLTDTRAGKTGAVVHEVQDGRSLWTPRALNLRGVPASNDTNESLGAAP